ncbi:MAG: DUF948 domain-containing protein [Chlamydiales bacterium]|nr:DUF948 domain-containing protein [Chlamydiales bacterium]
MSVIDISILIMAICSLVLTCVVGWFLFQALKILQRVAKTAEDIQKDVSSISQNATEITHDVHHKLRSLNPLFSAISQVGDNASVNSSSSLASQCIGFALTAVNIWKTLTKRRSV